MGFLSFASAASVWRGYEYYKGGKVERCQETNDGHYEGQVSGSGEKKYQVKINLEHPRSSQCSCPHAAGKQIVCKHMAALYFYAFPEESEDYYRELIKAEEKAEQEQERLENAVIEHVGKMKKAELQQALLQTLFDGPEWQFDRFVREYDIQ
ncbi:MAG: SWIM zinc finger family protein [Clostridia bacterium]|nr:SWIM zinc finger family protein [Clostridia bacterium]